MNHKVRGEMEDLYGETELTSIALSLTILRNHNDKKKEKKGKLSGAVNNNQKADSNFSI